MLKTSSFYCKFLFVQPFFGLFFLLACTLTNASEIILRPGLWQISTSSDLLLLVPYIPNEQMQEVKDLAKEYGLDLPQIEMGAAISHVCVSQALSIQKTLPVLAQNELGCVTKKINRTGNNYEAEIICNSADVRGSAIASATITSAESFTGVTHFVGSTQGNAINEKADVNGKWMHADCGEIKPYL